MCGIAGYIGKKKTGLPEIKQTLKLMHNRGPDNADHISFQQGDLHIALLHTRLSIIDMDERANQPFTIGPATIIFNGEIYNYLEIRKRLESDGVKFKTTSDTEVLLQAYLRFGEACVEQFEGMWSFAIYDRANAKLFLSRDRFAEKPLYYYVTPDGFYFASEVKFIRSLGKLVLEVDKEHLFGGLINGYKFLYKNDHTFFHGVEELKYATNLVIDQNLTEKKYRYWKPRPAIRPMSLDDAIEGFRHHLMESVKIRLRADVPLAFCLSGGVDSSTITSIAAKTFNYDVATFSIIDSDERYNELDNIRATIDDLGCRHNIIPIPQNELFTRLKKLIEYHDAPLCTITFFVHSLLLEAISAQGYKVSVAGTGADEIATGYYDHFLLHLYEMREHPNYQQYLKDWKEHVAKSIRNPFLKDPDLYFRDPTFRQHIVLDREAFANCLKEDCRYFVKDFTEEHFSDSMLQNRMLNEMFHEAVPVALHDDDLNSMFYSVENRSPYLDSRLFDFAYTVPPEHLIRDGYAKFVLREAGRGILNDQVRLDRRKRGFNASIHSVIDLEKKENREWILDQSSIYGYFDRSKIEAMLKIKPMTNSFSKFMFSFINAKVFLECHEGAAAPSPLSS